jgi:hypothetical protein
MEFPRLVYKSPTIHQLVEDAERLEAALSAGWFNTVPEAIKGVADVKPAEPSDAGESSRPPTRAELEEKAIELGIKFDGRTSDRKLLDQINAALEA